MFNNQTVHRGPDGFDSQLGHIPFTKKISIISQVITWGDTQCVGGIEMGLPDV